MRSAPVDTQPRELPSASDSWFALDLSIVVVAAIGVFAVLYQTGSQRPRAARETQRWERGQSGEGSDPARTSAAVRSSASRPTARKRGANMSSGDAVGAADLARRVGQRVRDERTARDMSFDDLSRASGVSRAALSQIETRKSSPSIAVMWKIAIGLGIPFSELLGGDTEVGQVLRPSDAQVLQSPDGRMESRPIAPAGTTPWVEILELRLSPAPRTVPARTRPVRGRSWWCSAAQCASTSMAPRTLSRPGIRWRSARTSRTRTSTTAHPKRARTT